MRERGKGTQNFGTNSCVFTRSERRAKPVLTRVREQGGKSLFDGLTNVCHNLLLVVGALGVRLGEGHCDDERQLVRPTHLTNDTLLQH